MYKKATLSFSRYAVEIANNAIGQTSFPGFGILMRVYSRVIELALPVLQPTQIDTSTTPESVTKFLYTYGRPSYDFGHLVAMLKLANRISGVIHYRPGTARPLQLTVKLYELGEKTAFYQLSADTDKDGKETSINAKLLS